MGGGPKPNSNVPIVDVPKWLRRGGVRPNWDNVLKYGFFFFEGIPYLGKDANTTVQVVVG